MSNAVVRRAAVIVEQYVLESFHLQCEYNADQVTGRQTFGVRSDADGSSLSNCVHDSVLMTLLLVAYKTARTWAPAGIFLVWGKN